MSLEELIPQYVYTIIIGGCLLIIIIYIIYYYGRSKIVNKQYKKYKEDHSMTQMHQTTSSPHYINCPLCQEKILNDVSFCPHCGKDIRNMEFQPIPVENNVEQPQNISRTFCNRCGKQLLGHPTFCSKCGKRL